jgi:hypothetical protein
MDAFVSGLSESTHPRHREQVAIDLRLMMRVADEEEMYMPVLLLWAVPAVIVVGGVGYYLVHAVH